MKNEFIGLPNMVLQKRRAVIPSNQRFEAFHDFGCDQSRREKKFHLINMECVQ
jgi:phage gpG-like protein